MIFTGLYLVRGEVSALVKFNEITFVVMFLPMLIILMFATRGGQVTNVMPLLQSPPEKYISALAISTYAFGGFEIAYLVLPFMKTREGLKKTLLSSVVFIALFYILVTILCLMFFTKDHVKNLLWPTIGLIRAIVIPGAFVERWEGIVMALWVLFYFTTFVNMYYFSGDIIKDAFNLYDIKLSSIILTPIIYITALYPENIAEVYDISGKVVPILSIFSFVVLPLALLMLSSFRRRGKKREC
jgi:spore germination protein (amino acid permease)